MARGQEPLFQSHMWDGSAVPIDENLEIAKELLKLASDAKAKSAAQSAERSAVEEAKLNERLAVAEGEIRAARDQAMTNVSAIAVETAQAIVERLTGDKVTKTAVKAALAGTK